MLFFSVAQRSFSYAQANGVQVLEMPYQGERLSMLVLLPEKPAGLAELESNLNAENWQRWTTGLRRQEVNVSFPRYKVEAAFALADTLKAMGMTDAFDAGKADFSGITPLKQPLWISAVIHKAFVEVNERGTEAAAATAVVMGKGRAAHDPTPPVDFRADHTFVYAIRDNQTGSLLFLGRLDRP